MHSDAIALNTFFDGWFLFPFYYIPIPVSAFILCTVIGQKILIPSSNVIKPNVWFTVYWWGCSGCGDTGERCIWYDLSKNITQKPDQSRLLCKLISFFFCSCSNFDSTALYFITLDLNVKNLRYWSKLKVIRFQYCWIITILYVK